MRALICYTVYRLHNNLENALVKHRTQINHRSKGCSSFASIFFAENTIKEENPRKMNVILEKCLSENCNFANFGLKRWIYSTLHAQKKLLKRRKKGGKIAK